MRPSSWQQSFTKLWYIYLTLKSILFKLRWSKWLCTGRKQFDKTLFVFWQFSSQIILYHLVHRWLSRVLTIIFAEISWLASQKNITAIARVCCTLGSLIKSRFSKKATKFETISYLIWRLFNKSSWRLFQIFVSFSESLNFTYSWTTVSGQSCSNKIMKIFKTDFQALA